MNALNLAGMLSLVPAATFLIVAITHFSARSAGQVLLADLGLGDKRRQWLQLLLLVTTSFPGPAAVPCCRRGNRRDGNDDPRTVDVESQQIPACHSCHDRARDAAAGAAGPTIDRL